MRTKAEFRALREMAGITQARLAAILGVEVRSVKRWESGSAPQHPPADAWSVLDEAMEMQRVLIDIALDRVDETEDEIGAAPSEVVLPYWSSDAEYRECSTDAALGIDGGSDGWRMANASSRALAAILRADGIAVRWVSGADNPARN